MPVTSQGVGNFMQNAFAQLPWACRVNQATREGKSFRRVTAQTGSCTTIVEFETPTRGESVIRHLVSDELLKVTLTPCHGGQIDIVDGSQWAFRCGWRRWCSRFNVSSAPRFHFRGQVRVARRECRPCRAWKGCIIHEFVQPGCTVGPLMIHGWLNGGVCCRV